MKNIYLKTKHTLYNISQYKRYKTIKIKSMQLRRSQLDTHSVEGKKKKKNTTSKRIHNSKIH